MEAVTAPNLPSAAGTSHARDQHPHTARAPLAPTRPPAHRQPPSLDHDEHDDHHDHDRARASFRPVLSQESVLSTASTASSAGSHHLLSGSDVSQASHYTDLTSSSAMGEDYGGIANGVHHRAADAVRVKTPENERAGGHAQAEPALASPMSISSPVFVNGTKRTASGHVKTPSLSAAPFNAARSTARARGDSASSTGSRAGELAASLKTRLGYAMAKVQHGWEHRNIVEVEELAATKARHSMSHVEYGRRPVSAGFAHSTARLSVQDPYAYARDASDFVLSPPSKRQSGSYGAHSFHHGEGPHLGAVPRLQPAPEIRSMNGSSRSYHPSSRPTSGPTTQYFASAMSPPRTPTNGHHRHHQHHPQASARRPLILRTETQTAQAERDALDALAQLGSPHVSQASGSQRPPFASQANSSQASSPTRGDFPTPRKVTFARSDSEQSTFSSSSSLASSGSIRAERQRALEGLEAR